MQSSSTGVLQLLCQMLGRSNVEQCSLDARSEHSSEAEICVWLITCVAVCFRPELPAARDRRRYFCGKSCIHPQFCRSRSGLLSELLSAHSSAQAGGPAVTWQQQAMARAEQQQFTSSLRVRGNSWFLVSLILRNSTSPAACSAVHSQQHALNWVYSMPVYP